MRGVLRGRRRPKTRPPVRPRAHREAARQRGRAGHLSRRRARRPAHRQGPLSGAWHPRRAPPSRARTPPRTYSCAGCCRSITSSSGRASDGSPPRTTKCSGSRRSASTGAPSRTGCTGRKGTPQIPRYFAFKLPIAVDEQARRRSCTSMRGRPPIASCARGAWPTRRSGPRSGRGRSPCTSSPSARASRPQTAPRPCWTRWTQDGDGQGAADPAGPTKADPDIRQEIARLETAISSGNRERLRAAGGFDAAADRHLESVAKHSPTARPPGRRRAGRLTASPSGPPSG